MSKYIEVELNSNLFNIARPDTYQSFDPEFYCGDEDMDDEEMDSGQKFKLEAQMQRSILDVDKQIQAKRKMLFDIEKENCMTVAATLRAIPKAPASKDNPLLEALKNGTD